MNRLLLRTKARLRDATKPIGEAAVGALTVGMLRATRYFDPIKTANLFGRILRLVGPMTREQEIGRANLTAAFPEKSPDEIETILAGVWDNLGRLGAEFAHIDHIWEHDPAHPGDSRIEIQTRTHELFAQLRRAQAVPSCQGDLQRSAQACHRAAAAQTVRGCAARFRCGYPRGARDRAPRYDRDERIRRRRDRDCPRRQREWPRSPQVIFPGTRRLDWRDRSAARA